jgi:8-oxo-dGTP pyrophosphatase MutT (NUDIX family)
MMPIEQCCGVVVIYRSTDEDLFLILQHTDMEGSWTFPKGHMESGETQVQTALRELREETGIKTVALADMPPLFEEYTVTVDGEKRLKHVTYFIGYVDDMHVVIQPSEIHTYRWMTYEKALETFTYDTRRETLRTAKQYIDTYGRN